MVGATAPVGGGSVATEAEVARGRFGFTNHVTRRVQTAGIDPSEQGGYLLRRLSRR